MSSVVDLSTYRKTAPTPNALGLEIPRVASPIREVQFCTRMLGEPSRNQVLAQEHICPSCGAIDCDAVWRITGTRRFVCNRCSGRDGSDAA